MPGKRASQLLLILASVGTVGVVALAGPGASRSRGASPQEKLVGEVAIQLEASAFERPDRTTLVTAALDELAASRSCLKYRFTSTNVELACGANQLDVAWPPKNGRAVGALLKAALTLTHGGTPVSNKTAESMARALANSVGDPFTTYLSASEVVQLSRRDRVATPGMHFKPTAPQVIHDIRPGSDAERQGLASGDKVLKIDGRSTEGRTFSDMTAMALGQLNSVIRLEVETVTGEQRKVYVKRSVLPEAEVSSERLPGGFLYLRVAAFIDGVARLLAEELWDNQNRGVVLDLRQNPGGKVKEGREVLDLFFSDGPIGGYRPRPGRPAEDFAAKYAPTDIDAPVVILIDGGSASASEYVTLVMKQRGRATVLGTTSLGKGTMQNSFNMDGGGWLKVTTARYVGIDGTLLPVGGIQPSRYLPRPRTTTVMDGGTARSDPWVLAALDVLEGEGRYGGGAISRYGPTP